MSLGFLDWSLAGWEAKRYAETLVSSATAQIGAKETAPTRILYTRRRITRIARQRASIDSFVPKELKRRRSMSTPRSSKSIMIRSSRSPRSLFGAHRVDALRIIRLQIAQSHAQRSTSRGTDRAQNIRVLHQVELKCIDAFQNTVTRSGRHLKPSLSYHLHRHCLL